VIEVTLPLKIPKSLSYLAPDEVRLGQRVIVPLRGKKTLGLITSLEGALVPGTRLVEAVVDQEPVLPEEELSFLRWVADYHLAPLGQVIRYALPRALFALPRRKALESFAGPIPPKEKGGGFSPFLLHEEDEKSRLAVYLRNLEEVLEKRQALFLLPEKKKLQELWPLLRERFPSMALYHGGLNPRERARIWLEVLCGKVSLVLGTRSALFLPFTKLGIIIVEDEDDPSYKEEQAFRYQARDLALMKGKFFEVKVILGSPAPSIKSFYWAKRGKYKLQKGEKRSPERLEIIDLRQNRGLLSQRLLNAVRLTLRRQEQVFFFLNRLGYAPALQCQECGYLWSCPRCWSPLAYHRQEEKLLCHLCRQTLPAPPICPECGGGELRFLGTGTERLWEIVQKFFPQARMARLDRETAKETIDFEGIDILIATRKAGWQIPLPRLSLIAVILADQMLGLPDWRAAERTYQILKRLSLNPARWVIIQTFHPRHPVFHGLQKGYEAFFQAEIKARYRAGFPPFKRLALLRFEDRDRQEVEALAERAKELLEKQDLEVFGPREERRRGTFYSSLLLRGSTEDLHLALKRLLREDDFSRKRERWLVDFDPD